MTSIESSTTLYLDTSALVKRYVVEKGSLWLSALCSVDAGHAVATALITYAEAAAAFARIARDGTLLPADHKRLLEDLAHDFGHEYATVEVSRELVDLAVDLTTRHKLRGYDELAAGLRLNEVLLAAQLAPVTFIAADDDLLTAARDEGLLVDNPNEHP